MKIRIEIIDDEGKENTSIEFAGENVKERVIKFIDTLDEVQPRSTGSSSSNLQSEQKVQQLFSQQTSATTPKTIVSQPPQVVAPHYYPVSVMPVPQQAQPYYQPVQMPVQQAQQYPQYYLPVNQQTVNPGVNPVVNQPVCYQQPVQPQQANVSSGNIAPIRPVQAAMTEQQVPQVNNNAVPNAPLRDKVSNSKLTINERLELFLKYEHPRDWSTSQQIQENYERVYGEIKLSTVSTYLSRMYRKNLLERRGNRTQREYFYIGDREEVAAQATQQGYAPAWQMQRL
ncbi:BlaI/MecI/CopY family transcriptional regulator [Methanococcoides methylutens]|uniref:BlaI/MecI/CopY family transcriptional regulator n=1 Tax=Methanococcoides methylutens TaxID=2226 RepID=UPI000693514D|nr:hypothetical protein [Methanococcoides methylutens]